MPASGPCEVVGSLAHIGKGLLARFGARLTVDRLRKVEALTMGLETPLSAAPTIAAIVSLSRVSLTAR